MLPCFCVLTNQSHEPDVGYMKLAATDEMAGEVTFSNADVLKGGRRFV